MESQRPIPLPTDSNNAKEAPEHGRKRRGHFDDLPATEIERRRQERAASIEEFLAEYEAELARRRALSWSDRLKEDGDQLRQKIEADPEMIVVFEESRSLRARCRAGDDCVFVQAKGSSGSSITTKYRICVYGVENEDWYGRTKHFYHLLCFECMVDLDKLLPENFRLDASCLWGLMVEEWFKHNGRIDVDRIEAFLEEYTAYEEKYREWYQASVVQDLDHARNCRDEESGCKCVPVPKSPRKPKLGDHTTADEDIYDLSVVLEHPSAEKSPDRFSHWRCEDHSD